MDKPNRVLLVEDNQESAGDYKRWLRAAGYEVEHATSRADVLEKAKSFAPHVVLLDLQIPSAPNRADEDVNNGFAALDGLLKEDPFRPVVVATAHSHNRELMRQVMTRSQGAPFVFKDAEELERDMLDAVAVALKSPAYLMSKTVRTFRAMLDEKLPEDDYRRFIHRNWQALLGPEYKDCQSPYELARGAKIDILAIRHDGFPDLWELKRPDQPIFESYNQWLHHSKECALAIGQLMEYYDLAEREPQFGNRNYDKRRGVDVQLHRPRGFVVIGRYKDEAERERLRLENSFFAGLTVMTYDDLIERAEQFVSFLQRYRSQADLL